LFVVVGIGCSGSTIFVVALGDTTPEEAGSAGGSLRRPSNGLPSLKRGTRVEPYDPRAPHDRRIRTARFGMKAI
jgi:hypothetical protein